MNINIDYGTRIPIYEQIVNAIENQVALGILLPNTQIPSIRDLAYSLGINPNTVKKAYDILVEKNVIVSKSTKGMFIADNISEAKEQKIATLIKDIKEKIKELTNYGIEQEEILKRLK